MTQYADKTKLLAKYPVFTDFTDDEINDALLDADALIDGYLSSKFTIDPDNIPRVVERVACDLACYYLQKSNLQAQAEESHSKLYNDCVKVLKDIANGTITLFEPIVTEESSGDFVVISGAGSFNYMDDI